MDMGRRRIVNEKQFNPRFFKRLKVAVEDVDGQFAVAITYPDCLTHKQAKVLRDHLEHHFHDSLQRITVAGK